jgi:hypothetical protein
MGFSFEEMSFSFEEMSLGLKRSEVPVSRENSSRLDTFALHKTDTDPHTHRGAKHLDQAMRFDPVTLRSWFAKKCC